MKDYSWLAYIIPVVTAILGGFGGKYLTKRERRKSDLEMIQEAINPLLESITKLTTHNSGLTEKLQAEQTKNLALMEERFGWMSERAELVDKVAKLEKRVATLAKEIKNMRDEKDSADTAA